MMTTVVCTECGEPSVITSRAVNLPFVCGECGEAQEFQKAIAPAANEADESVENTTLLIEDLETQLRNERAVIMSLEARIDNLLANLTTSEEANRRLAGGFIKTYLLGKMMVEDMKKLEGELETSHKNEDETYKKLNTYIRQYNSQRDRAEAAEDRFESLKRQYRMTKHRADYAEEHPFRNLYYMLKNKFYNIF